MQLLRVFISDMFLASYITHDAVVGMFLFLDIPEPPGTPEVSDITKTSAVVSWQPPSSDGGSKITGYVLEMREQFSSRWTVVTKPKDIEHKVTKLTPGKEYEFRVRAENKAGLSEPSPPSATFVAKDAYGKHILHSLIKIFTHKEIRIPS